MSGVAAVILAAGASSRLGEPKQLVKLGGELDGNLDGERLLERAVRVAVAAGCSPVVVVLGAQAERILAACVLEGVCVEVNEAWADGMASSIHAGLRAVGDVVGAILMTCDQPAVTGEHLALLMEGGDAIVASRYSGRNGVPAYFPVRFFSELMGLRGDEGARRVLGGVSTVELAGGELDVDTREALERARVWVVSARGADGLS